MSVVIVVMFVVNALCCWCYVALFCSSENTSYCAFREQKGIYVVINLALLHLFLLFFSSFPCVCYVMCYVVVLLYFWVVCRFSCCDALLCL